MYLYRAGHIVRKNSPLVGTFSLSEMAFNIRRRNMEPPDADWPKFRAGIAFFNEIQAVEFLMHHGKSIPPVQIKAVRLRGGAGSEPNTDSKFNEIPYLSKMNFMWPIAFVQKRFYRLCCCAAEMQGSRGPLRPSPSTSPDALTLHVRVWRPEHVQALRRLCRPS